MSRRSYTAEEIARYLEDSDCDADDPFSGGSDDEYQPSDDEEDSEDIEVIENFITRSAVP